MKIGVVFAFYYFSQTTQPFSRHSCDMRGLPHPLFPPSSRAWVSIGNVDLLDLSDLFPRGHYPRAKDSGNRPHNSQYNFQTSQFSDLSEINKEEVRFQWRGGEGLAFVESVREWMGVRFGQTPHLPSYKGFDIQTGHLDALWYGCDTPVDHVHGFVVWFRYVRRVSFECMLGGFRYPSD